MATARNSALTHLHECAGLVVLASRLLQRAGLSHDRAATVANILVEADCMGHDTHGLALLAPYLDALASGDMAATGEPTVIADTAVAETWDGHKLPGPWLTVRAVNRALDRAAAHGIGAVAIRRSHHIACLAAYLPIAIERGQMLIVTCSDPATASVAPWGGTRRLTTPNPIAAGWPTPAGPVLLDVSMSITTNGMTARRRAAGERFPFDALADADGRPTDDPNAFFTDPGGSLLPLGAPAAGHKGFALGLLVEALTSALAGHGRADTPTGWGASVLVLAIDPARFGGAEAFAREAGWMAEAVRANPPIPGGPAPRLPGDAAWARRAEARANGVALHPAIPPVLAARAAAAGLAMPAAL